MASFSEQWKAIARPGACLTGVKIAFADLKDKEKLQERLAKLAGGVAVVKVGAAKALYF